ncbi:leucine-rich repeat domain-containing protein [Gammaproteobacteria bacterium]|nr:leucine-rich repeat domain-containing protein [Gammaproteobacteria bacterium]
MLSRSTLQTKRHGSVKKSEQPEELENKIDKKLSRKIDSEKTINKHVYYISNGELSFEDGTINIPSSAFENNKEITSIILPSSLIEIERGAFAGCSNLTHVELNKGLQEIGEFAFQYCTKLTHIKLPEGLKKIERWAFAGCSNLTHVELNKGLQEIGEFAFQYCTKLTHIKLPEGLKKIERGAFEGCSNLTHIKFNKSLQEIQKCAFHSCINLKYVIYGGTNEQIISQIQSQLPTALLINPSDLPDDFDTWSYQKQTIFLELKYSIYTLSYKHKIHFLTDQNLDLKDQLTLLKTCCPSIPFSVIQEHHMPLSIEVFKQINADINIAHYSGYQYLSLSDVYKTYCLLSKSNFFTHGICKVSSDKNSDHAQFNKSNIMSGHT